MNKTSLKHLVFPLLVLFSCLLPMQTFAMELPLPKSGDVVGRVYQGVAKRGETLADVGRRYDIGYYEMIVANSGIHPLRRLHGGTKLTIPAQFILPSGPRKGIVINLAELRLYYYPPGKNIVITEPVGIGREDGWETPTGSTHITSKVKDPVWRPTKNVRAEAARKGTPIPSIFPPGPDNPLGKHVLRLGWPTYLIHGTNRPEGVGSRVSAGCIRMLPEDVENLFKIVRVGTKVRVINEPYKAGWKGKELYFESHPPLKENEHVYEGDPSRAIESVQQKIKGKDVYVHWSAVKKAIKYYSGIPKAVGRL